MAKRKTKKKKRLLTPNTPQGQRAPKDTDQQRPDSTSLSKNQESRHHVSPWPANGHPGGQWDRQLWIGAILLVSTFFLIIKAFSLNPYAGDEYIYLHHAQMVAEGIAPYSGFSMAHPPLQMLFTGFIFKITGFNFLLARMLPVTWCLVGGLILAWMVRREYGNMASVVTVILYLTAHEPLRASSHYTGVNMTVALLIAAVAAYRRDAIRMCALVCVCAVFTRFYAAPGVLILTLFALISNPKQGLRLVGFGAAIGGVAAIAVMLWTGFDPLYHNLVEYHQQKTAMTASQLSGMKDRVLFHNATIAALFALSVVTLLAVLIRTFVIITPSKEETGIRIWEERLRTTVQSSRTGLAILSTAIATGFLLILTNMDRVWMYYFIPSFPFAAVTAGWMVSLLTHGAIRLIRTRLNWANAGISQIQFAGGLILTTLFILSLCYAPYLEARLGYYQREMEKPPEQRVHTYTFEPSLLPDWLNDGVRALLWNDDRIIGEVYHTFNYLFWHESRVLDIVDDVVETIEQETSEGAAIFGDSGTVPLFALLSGRRIALNEADTNVQRYRTGFVDVKELISNIDNPKTEMIILRGTFGVAGVPELRRLVATKYKRIKAVRSAQGKVYSLFKRR